MEGQTKNRGSEPARGESGSVVEEFLARAAERPRAIAVEDGGRRLTYAELAAASAGVAAGLRAAGVENGEPVGVCLPRSWQAVVAFLGILRAGGAYVPVSPTYPADRRRRTLELAGARIGLSEVELPPGIQRLDVEALAGSAVAGEPSARVGGEALAYVLFTSGSTGSPKGVEVTHLNLLNLLRRESDVVPRRDDVVLQVVPLEFDVSGLEIWGALLNGAELAIAPRGRPDPSRLGQLIAARGVTYLGISTGLLHELTTAALPDLGGLRLVCAAGDVMSPVVARELREAHPSLRLLNGYGPTETTILASAHEFEPGDADGVPIGRALPGYRLYVLDEDGEPVPPGEDGELWIAGAGVARGYRGDPELTRERFREDPFEGGRRYRSGDLVRLREDGELLFLGRADDQVKISGQRVEPGEVQRALVAHPGVREAAVIAREEVRGHKRLLAFVARQPSTDPTPEELRAHLAARLPAFMVPSWITVLEALPLNERGKVDHAALPGPEREAGGSAGGEVAPVAALMAEVLEVDEVGPGEDFFALGGSSLLAIRLVGLVRERLGAAVGIDAVFEAPTAAALAARIERDRDDDEAPAVEVLPELRPGPRRSTAPLTAAQRRAWLFGRMHPESIAYQFAAIFRFEGELDEGALEGALADLIARHESLRTAFEERDGEPVQVVRESCPVPLEKIDLRGEDSLAWARLARARVRARIDPAEPPLVRWALARLGEGSWALVQVEHHLIHDGWSFALLAGELAHLYSARVEGREPALPPLEVQMQDYARWEAAAHASEEVRRQVTHWAQTLDPEPPLMQLPTARPRPARESFAGGSVRRRLGPELTARLRELAGAQGGTLFMATLAAFLVQLHRYSGRDDLQIGTGLANRRDRGSEQVVGMIVNTVAMRYDLGGDPSVRELLERVRRVALDAYGNPDAPFDAVVEAVRPPRDPRRSPLVQALFSFHDAPRSGERWAGLETRLTTAVPNGTAKADLNVIGIDEGDGELTFVWEHSDLLDDAAADRLAGHHQRLLEQFVTDPDARLSELTLLDEQEAALIEGWARSSEGFDREATVPGLVARQAAARPEAVAIIDGAERISYRELMRRARSVAGALRDRGVGRGDAVGVLLPRSARGVAAALGALEAGAAYVPLDPAHPAARSERAIADAGVRIVIADPGLREQLPAGVELLAPTEALAAEPTEEGLAEPEGLAYVMYTSGSTGVPKGVEVTHRNVARLVDDPGFADLGPGCAMLHAASPAFDATTLELWGPLANGGTVVVLGEQPGPDAVAVALERHDVNTMWLTAGLFNELVDRRPESLRSVRHLLAGGEVLSPGHVSRALAAMAPGARLTNGYGPTETTTFALTHDLRPGDRVGASIPLGRPVQATSCEVIDASGRPAPIGVPGELWIGGDGVSRGYRGDPELTAEKFVDDPARPGARRYRSGDRVRLMSDGTIEFLGRIDRQLKVRGFRVEPGEIESVLRERPDVADAVVAPFERAPGDRALAAYVVPAGVGGAPGRKELRDHALAQLPAAMVPAAWVMLDRLPLNANGKVDRDRLPSPSREDLARSAGGDSAARDDLERELAAIFARVLGIEGVGAEEDFFALGGHSLLAVRLFEEIERTTGRRLPLSTVFERPTVRLLAPLLAPSAPRPEWSNLVPLKPFGSRPPLFAATAGDGNVVGFGPLAKSISPEQPLYALQPSGLDGHAAIDRGIEAMAARCVEEMRTVQPRGPYLLAGRCNGATVAFEIAQQLRRAGEEVPLLVALDSDPPHAGPRELEAGLPADPFMEAAWLRAGGSESELDELGGRQFAAWLRTEAGPGVTRYGHEVWHWREDLRERWPDPLGADAAALAIWLWESGLAEHELAPQLLTPAPVEDCRTPEGQPWNWALAAGWEALGREPVDPLTPRGWRRLRNRLGEPIGDGRANRYLLAVARRPDLAAHFRDPLGADLDALLAWAWTDGLEEGLAPRLLPPPPVTLEQGARTLRSLWRRLPKKRAGELFSEPSRKRLAGHCDRLLDLAERRLRQPLPQARRRLDERIVAAAREARDAYRAEPWPGRVVLVTSAEYESKPAYLAWPERALGGIDRRPLPIGHVEMLRDRGAPLLAACLDECIGEAISS